MAKGPVYKSNMEVVDSDLLQQLCDAIADLEQTMVPDVEIKRGGTCHMGYGVRKSKRSIAADTVIAIARQIKGKPGW